MTEGLPPDRTLEQRRLLLEQVDGRLNGQFDELDGLDRKATTVLAGTGVVLGLVVNKARPDGAFSIQSASLARGPRYLR